MPIDMQFVKTRLAKLIWQKEQEKPKFFSNSHKKKNKIFEKMTSDQIEEIICVQEAMYFDLHREGSELFNELQMLGWPESKNKKTKVLEKRYIFRHAKDWLIEN